MLKPILGKIARSLVLLWVLLTAVFFLVRFAPGGPFDTDRVLPPDVQAQMEAQYGLNAPIGIQYLRWARGLLSGDLGYSFTNPDQKVAELLGGAIGVSFGLGSAAILAALVLGTAAGILSAAFEGRWIDRALRLLVISCVSLPGFLAATLLVWVFSVQLGWLPPALWAPLLEGPEFWVLPAITLSLRPLALVTRLVRQSVLDALGQDYIRTARSKGVSEPRVLRIHALRNAWIPCIGLVPQLSAHVLTGSFLVESVFQIPGLGRSFVSGVLNRDYPMVMGTTLLFGMVLLAFTLLGDLLLQWADPRLRGEA